MVHLRDLELRIHYEAGDGSILASFVQPAVGASIRYDRLTGYFSVSSLIAISEGIEDLWKRGGRMRLVLGIHDVPVELIEASHSPDWPGRVIDSVRDRLLRGVSSLTDEFARDRVATVAWMMKDGLLDVRVAAPERPSLASSTQSIFHNKRLIFSDEVGDIVSAVGSPNETYGGLVANYEELTVHMSWSDPQGYVQTHQDSFDRIWKGDRPGLVVRVLDAEFADRLLVAAGRPASPPLAPRTSPYREFLAVARGMPQLAFLNLSNAALYPHQERAVLDALNRWPIRVLLADEVGLGKTLEAGAVLAFLIRTNAVRRVLILAPKNVTRQWREEMSLHFGLDFWLYESGSRTYESATGRLISVPPGERPLGIGSPNLLIVSAQLARGSSRSSDLLSGAQLPDLLLVDEAHSARVRMEIDGTRRPTLLWKLLDRHRDAIPHLVLLTATPMQLEWTEYYSLLQLLGLPDGWSSSAYERSLRLLTASSRPTLDEAADAVSLVVMADEAYGSDARPLDSFVDADASAAIKGLAAQRHWDDVFQSLVAAHPASILTVRNSRQALERLGYTFPERNFVAPPLEVPPEVRRFYEKVEVYLREAYGLTEQAAAPDRGVQLGFVKSTYYQRLASSLTAARRTLDRRLARLESASNFTASPEPGEPDDYEEFTPPDFQGTPPGTRSTIERAAALERTYVRDLLDQLDRIEVEGIRDPKLEALTAHLAEHLAQGDRVLVFSRYTDTVDACLAAAVSSLPPFGHAMYTGGNSWVDAGDGPVPATKEGVRKAIEKGTAAVVFCSDAASEGLNLQAARVIINVDVPWNPARLEQRIGRVARLGQHSATVDVVNLWYPDSVEARMYGRLLMRRDLYELAVGSLPEIVSEAIRQEVASRYDRAVDTPQVDALARLQMIREDIQIRAIARVWERGPTGASASTASRAALISLIETTLVRAGTDVAASNGRLEASIAGRDIVLEIDPGTSDAVSLRHGIFDELVPRTTLSANDEIVCVESQSVPVAIGVRRGGLYCLIPPKRVVDVLACLLDARPLRIASTVEWYSAQDFIRQGLATVSVDGPCLPGKGSWRIPTTADVIPPDDVGTIRVVGPLWTAPEVVT